MFDTEGHMGQLDSRKLDVSELFISREQLLTVLVWGVQKQVASW